MSCNVCGNSLWDLKQRVSGSNGIITSLIKKVEAGKELYKKRKVSS